MVVHVLPPSVEYWYEVMALPPSSAGAAQERAVWPLPGVAVRFCGAEGIVSGVAEIAAELSPLPALFTARTHTEYAVPFVSPVSV